VPYTKFRFPKKLPNPGGVEAGPSMSNGERADLGQQLSVRGVSMGSMGKRTKKKGENGRGKDDSK